MIRILVHAPKTRRSESCDPTQLEHRLADDSLILWLDLEGEAVRDEQTLLNYRIDLPMAAVRAFQCLEGPTLEERAGHVLLRFDELFGQQEQGLTTLPLSFFFTQRLLITRHADTSPAIEQLRQELMTCNTAFFHPAHIAACLASIVAARYLGILSLIEDQLDEVPHGKATEETFALLHASLSKLRAGVKEHATLLQAMDNLALDLSVEVRDHFNMLREFLQQALDIARRYHIEYGLKVL